MKTYLVLVAPIAAFVGGSAISAAAAPGADQLARGKVLYARCAACHATTASAPKKLGPHLQGLAGRKAGSIAGFTYSPAMKRSAVRWNDATLDKFIQKPAAVVPGTTMSFVGIANAADRAALIAYLKQPS